MNTQVKIEEATNTLFDEIINHARDLKRVALKFDKCRATAQEVRDEIAETRMQISQFAQDGEDDQMMEATKKLRQLNNKLDRMIDGYTEAESEYANAVSIIKKAMEVL